MGCLIFPEDHEDWRFELVQSTHFHYNPAMPIMEKQSIFKHLFISMFINVKTNSSGLIQRETKEHFFEAMNVSQEEVV